MIPLEISAKTIVHCDALMHFMHSPQSIVKGCLSGSQNFTARDTQQMRLFIRRQLSRSLTMTRTCSYLRFVAWRAIDRLDVIGVIRTNPDARIVRLLHRLKMRQSRVCKLGRVEYDPARRVVLPLETVVAIDAGSLMGKAVQVAGAKGRGEVVELEGDLGEHWQILTDSASLATTGLATIVGIVLAGCLLSRRRRCWTIAVHQRR